VFGHTVDARTDVYSLGATAFEMLTGAPPFVGQVPQILSSKATEEAPDLLDAGVPAAVAHTIGRMLAREPEHRAPSMVWVLDEVARWAQVEAPTDRIHEVHEEEPNASRMFARGATALAAGGGDPATTSQAMRVLALPHGRARRRTALAISFGVLAMAAAAVLIGGSSSRRATPTSSRSHDVQEPSAGSATTRGVPPPAPLEPQARAHDTPAPASGSAARATAPAEDSAEPGEDAASDPERDPASARGSGQAPNGDRADEPADDRAASGSGVPHRPRAKPPAKKPPAKKRPAKKPPPGTSKDVLIVDPFSSGS
jgi:serine/threonine-protein kinase